VVGTSDSGKTTLLEKIIPELRGRGYRVAVVKHDAHSFEIDHEGKDSWRLKRAGAHAVVISSPSRIALIEEVGQDHSLEALRERLRLDVDIILSEGYKGGPHPKIEVFRRGHRPDLLCGPGDGLVAIASDVPLERGVPCVDINDARSLVDIIEARFLRKERRR
jgi:molybdopterin-guanine dinucleotide biosynthesis protein MobB